MTSFICLAIIKADNSPYNYILVFQMLLTFEVLVDQEMNSKTLKPIHFPDECIRLYHCHLTRVVCVVMCPSLSLFFIRCGREKTE
jgi:hypothetical protein